jgi:4-amino-4-deoxy-L-arabinose transferase-like glycosyltransferase
MRMTDQGAAGRREGAHLWPLIVLAGATVIVHALVGGRYGFHRDELATLDDARHLAWGYVAYPPVTPFLGWLSLHLFGTSLAGFRFFASLAGGFAIVLTGMMAAELGGGRWTQLFAACATTPMVIATGTLMQYVSFDYVAWVAVAYFVARLCRTNDPCWWLAVGAAIGFGMLSKYSMPFLVAGLGVGVLSGDLRAHFRSKWLWLGAAVSIVIFLPNLLWQWQHDFISLQFLEHIHARDVRIGRTKDFLPDQLELMSFALPVAASGLFFYFSKYGGRQFRVLGWMFVVPFALFLVAQGRGYYMAAGYPILYAGGAVMLAIWVSRLSLAWRTVAGAIGWTALLINIAFFGALFLPIAPVNSPWWHRMAATNDDVKEEIGWQELVETVARIRDALPPEDRARVRILAGNYGEAGAVDLYGPALGLPPAICPVNSFWERGYGDPPPEVLIVIGSSREDLEDKFDSCELVGHITNREGVSNEETSRHPDIFLCRHLRGDWQTVWAKARRFG